MPSSNNIPQSWDKTLYDGAAALGIALSGEQISQYRSFTETLLLWNKKINLTAITNPVDIAVKHFVDSLAAAEPLAGCQALVDIGAGAGFPGLPLKILFPEMKLTLMDSVRKKVSFLNAAIRSLGLQNARAIHARVENLAGKSEYRGVFDAAVSRAFSDMKTFLQMALPLVRTGGRIVALKGPNVADELAPLLRDGMRLSDGCAVSGDAIDCRSYSLPLIGDLRTLVVVSV